MKTELKNIYLISVPHQRKASLTTYDSANAVIIDANRMISQKNDDYEYCDTLEDAKEYITHDLNCGIWIETVEDIQQERFYTGHQRCMVDVLLDDIEEVEEVEDNLY